MTCSGGYIDCSKNYPNSLREKPFYVVCFSLDYLSNKSDQDLIDNLYQSAQSLARKVNPKRANNSAHYRSDKKILSNCLAGVLSEYFWKAYINENVEVVQSTELVDIAAQIDLEVINNSKKIEVRSSFPRKGVEFAICNEYHQFRIVGPYSNLYKSGEVQKDYYVSALFPMQNPEQILEKVKQGRFTIYLTGGATWDMMWDSKTSQKVSLVPEDSFGSYPHESVYQVVPFSHALDAKEIKEIIISDSRLQHIIPLYYSVQEDEQYSKYLPFYEVKVACGAFIEGGIPEELGWIDVEAEGIRANNKRFIVKASGDSMLPKIKSGDLCVFERNWAGSRNGQIVLAQSRDFDPDYTGKYTIKKYQSVTNQTSEWDIQKSVDLIPLNQDYEVIHLSEDDDVQIIGVLIGTIQGGEFKELEEPEELHIGYCIRCGKAIDYSFNNEKPILYCKECWRAWRSNGSNPDAPERYCHRCGKSAKPKYKDAISFNYPICADCWKDR